MKRLLKLWWLALPLVIITGSAIANNYNATQGSGTTFASVLLGGTTNYLANMLCDFTAGETQCAAVNVSGQVGVTGPVTQSGTWNTRMQDAGGNGISSDARGTERPLSVQILDASGNQITSFGGTGAVTQSGIWNMRLQDGAGTPITSSTRGAQQPLSVQVLDASGNQVTTFGGSSGAVATPPTMPSQASWTGFNVGGTFTGATGTGGSMNVNITNLNANDQHANNLSAPVVLSNQQMVAAGSPSPTQVITVQGVTGMTPVAVSGPASEYPSGSVPLTGTAGTSSAASTVTLTSSAGHTVFICSLSYRSNATTAVNGNLQVAGVITNTINYMHWTAPVTNGMGITEEVYSPCVPASAQNTNIVVTSPAPGTGGGSSLTATGYLAVGNGY